MALILSGDTGVPASGMPAGSVIQTVSATYGTEATTTSSSLSNTGLSATITPTFASSKILILFSQNGCGKTANETRLSISLLRNSTIILTSEQLGGYNNSTTPNAIGSCSGEYLDSPSTTSAVTYKTQFSSTQNVGTVVVQWNGGVSTITLMEIKQ